MKEKRDVFLQDHLFDMGDRVLDIIPLYYNFLTYEQRGLRYLSVCPSVRTLTALV